MRVSVAEADIKPNPHELPSTADRGTFCKQAAVLAGWAEGDTFCRHVMSAITPPNERKLENAFVAFFFYVI